MRSLPTIRSRLVVVVLACVLPAIVGFGLLFYAFYKSERTQFANATLASARAMVLAIDRDLNGAKMAAMALATSPYLANDDLAAFHAQARSLLSKDFPGINFVLSDARGQQLVNTLRPFGSPLPMHGSPEQARRIVETGKPVISDLYIGRVLGRAVLSIDVPVWRNGRVSYELAVGIPPEFLGKVLSEQHLPEGYIGAIFDTKGVIVARTLHAQQFIGKKGNPQLIERIRQIDAGEEEITTLEGIAAYTFFSRSPVSAWTVAIFVPKHIVLASLLKSLALLGLVVLALSLIGLAFAWSIGGAISASVSALASPSAPSASSGRAPRVPMTFKEAEVVAEQLARHQQLLDERAAQLSCDIEERKRIEKQLNLVNEHLVRSEQFTREITDNLPLRVSYLDTGLRCRFANKRDAAWFNKTPEEIVGIHIQDLLGPELFALNSPYLQLALGGARQDFERRLPAQNGEFMDVWTNYIPDRDASGNVIGILVLVADVTPLKLAKEAQRIAATAFESHEAMMITDANTVVLRVNGAFSELTGYASEDIVGKTPSVLKSGRHDEAFYAAMWDSIHRSGSWKGEIWDRRKNGDVYPSYATITAVKGDDGEVSHYVSTQTDITARKAAEEEIAHLAFFDLLTGLPNRRLLMDRLRHAAAAFMRTGQHGALMFLDLDQFKGINDNYGHDKGDLLLKQVAQRLSSCIREGDTVARLGGDEFMVLLEMLSEDAGEASFQAGSVGEKILASLNVPHDLEGLQYHSTASIGVALFTDHACNIEELLKRADIAMYQAKAAGRNALRFFDKTLQAIVTSHAALDAEFRQGLREKEFVLHFQAQVDKLGCLTGVEALVRWRHPRRGILPPAEFIALAEETGLILPLGHWVLETACVQLAAWGARARTAHLTMAVNVSAIQFHSADYVEQALAVLTRTGANPCHLKLEITESLLLSDMEDTISKMLQLQSHGVAFSLDDFGTGYSSLSYLSRLPLNQLKIDRSFVADILTDHNDATIASAIVALGQKLELIVIAEGVETEAQRMFLADHNCNAYQGFLFGRPLPIAEFEDVMER